MKAHHQHAGFSLVEVMCAILIMGVAIAGLTEGIAIALKSSKESELQTTAALLAAGLIETLRAEGNIQNGSSEGECGSGLALYRWKQSIVASDVDGLHDVTVTVEHSKSGQAIYELRTLLFEPPEETLQDSKSKQKNSGSRKKGGRGA